MSEIFKGMPGSPITYLASDISAGQTTISVADDTALPDAPNICTIGYGEELETIKYGTKSNGVLQNVTRGIEGAPRAWQAGTEVARFFTAYDHDAIAEVLSKNPVWFSEFEEALINSVSTKIFKNLFGNGSKIHASEIAVAPGLLLPGAVIVESGSNENGYWVKWGDGTMECTHELMTTSTSEETFGALFFIRYPEWTFPKQFVGIPHVSPTNISGAAQITATRTVTSNSALEFYGYRGTSFGSTLTSMRISVKATGRWK